MLLATAQSNSFPDTIKKAAFEDIIGNYFAFDPFLQPGRKGRVLEYYSEPDKQSSVGNFKEDSVPYSLPPPAYYADSEDFDENPPVYISNPSKFSDANLFINDHSANDAFNYKQFKNFQDEEYPQHSEFPINNKDATQSFTKDSTIPNLPKYVLGIDEKPESAFPSHDELNIRGPVYRGQVQQVIRSFNSIGKQPRIFNRQAVRTQGPISRYNYFEEPDMY